MAIEILPKNRSIAANGVSEGPRAQNAAADVRSGVVTVGATSREIEAGAEARQEREAGKVENSARARRAHARGRQPGADAVAGDRDRRGQACRERDHDAVEACGDGELAGVLEFTRSHRLQLVAGGEQQLRSRRRGRGGRRRSGRGSNRRGRFLRRGRRRRRRSQRAAALKFIAADADLPALENRVDRLLDHEPHARSRDRVHTVSQRHAPHVHAPARRIDQEQRRLAGNGEIEEHARQAGRRLAGRRDGRRHVLRGHDRLARGDDVQSLRREHLANRRREQIRLVRRGANHQLDAPAGGARILRSQADPRARAHADQDDCTNEPAHAPHRCSIN